MKHELDAYTRRTEQTKAWNKRNYRERSIRLHRGSDLDDRLGTFIATGGSLNYLITDLLANHFDVPNPYKRIHTRHVVQIYP
jgi:hypothetical protein